MDSDKTPPEDLDVRLYWPGEERRPPEPAVRPKSSTRGRSQRAEDSSPTRTEAVRPQVEAVASIPEGDQVGATLGSIAMRLESLANTTALLRTVVADRLADYSDQVARAQSISARDLEDYKRGHERMLGDIEASLREGENAIQRLERSTSDALTRVEDATRQLDGKLEAVHGRLEHVSRLEDATRQLDGRLDGLYERLEQSLSAASQPAGSDTSLILDVLLELRSDLESKSDEQAGVLVEAVTTALARIESALPKGKRDETAKLLELVTELHTRLDDVTAADQESSGDAPTIERLDRSAEAIARLEEAVSRLGEAQAEDLERLMDTIESLGAPEGSFVAARINHFSRQLDGLDKKLDVLRRRIALRARSDQALDDESIERVAEAVVGLLRAPEQEAPPGVEPARRRTKRG